MGALRRTLERAGYLLRVFGFIALVFGIVVVVVHRHKERMAMIRMGMNPDAPSGEEPADESG